jgi:hypothetical protein
MSASLIGRSGSSAFRLSTVAVSISLTGFRFYSDGAPEPEGRLVSRATAEAAVARRTFKKDCPVDT